MFVPREFLPREFLPREFRTQTSEEHLEEVLVRTLAQYRRRAELLPQSVVLIETLELLT